MFRNFFRRGGIALGSIALGSIAMLSMFLTSCLKDKDVDNNQTSAAGLMAFNLVPDQQAVQVALSGNLVPGSPFAYTSFTGRYISIFPGSRFVESANATGESLDSLTYNFEPGKYYSLFVVGSGSNYRNIVVPDNFDSLTASSGKAYVRYINGLSNAASSAVTINSGASNVVNASAPFGQVSEFFAVNPGDVAVSVSNEGAANASRTISLSQHKAYTILLTGLPNQSDTTKAVQIRFIENGTVTD
jgi:Domain of unknown function (DUF4397)